MLKLLLLILPLLSFAQDEKAIIGVDNRYQVKAYTDQFYQAVGLLQTLNGKGICTATLISPTAIITNGHCVVEDHEKIPMKLSPVTSFTFVPGLLDAKSGAPFGTYKVRRVDTLKAWTETGDMAYDVAVLHLTTPVKLPQVIVHKVSSEASVESRQLYVTGYPGDKPYGTLWECRGTLRDAVISSNRIVHNADTIPGESGSIIRVKVGNSWAAVGVHRGSVNQDNVGVLFTPNIYNAIQRWLKN
jgi:glutamyl endopeptidase